MVDNVNTECKGTDISLASDLFKDRLFGPKDWKNKFGANISEEDKNMAREIPWPIDVLIAKCPFEKEDEQKRICDTHFLFWSKKEFVFGDYNKVSILTNLENWTKMFNKYISFDFGKKEIINSNFIGETITDGWNLIPVNTDKWFLEKNLLQQLFIIPEQYALASVIQETLFSILLTKNGTRNQNPISKRCFDIDNNGFGRVVYFKIGKGVIIGQEGIKERSKYLSLAIHRKKFK
jgi:hypothetical protein